MKEVRAIIADKKVIEVMNALHGLTLEPPVWCEPDVRHQINESASKGHNGASAHLDQFMAALKKSGAKTVSGKQMRSHMEMGGFGGHSYSYRLQQLLESKALKRTKVQGIYEVL